MIHMKFGFDWPRGFKRDVWTLWNTTTTTTTTPEHVHPISSRWALDSGELNIDFTVFTMSIMSNSLIPVSEKYNNVHHFFCSIVTVPVMHISSNSWHKAVYRVFFKICSFGWYIVWCLGRVFGSDCNSFWSLLTFNALFIFIVSNLGTKTATQ